jgi:hypothetical protein
MLSILRDNLARGPRITLEQDEERLVAFGAVNDLSIEMLI